VYECGYDRASDNDHHVHDDDRHDRAADYSHYAAHHGPG